MKRTFVMGDIHGHIDKLEKCLDSVNFDFKKDKLIQLGDVVDRGVDSYSCIELLLSIDNLLSIAGNHDESWFKSLKEGNTDKSLLWKHGAKETSESYAKRGINPKIHFDFFNNQFPYYIDDQRRYFVHGGFNRHEYIWEQSNDAIYNKDRDLWSCAVAYENMVDKTYGFKIKGKPLEVFIGHISTLMWGISTPMKAANIWNLDTGCGKDGLLTIMNLETKEFKQF